MHPVGRADAGRITVTGDTLAPDQHAAAADDFDVAAGAPRPERGAGAHIEAATRDANARQRVDIGKHMGLSSAAALNGDGRRAHADRIATGHPVRLAKHAVKLQRAAAADRDRASGAGVDDGAGEAHRVAAEVGGTGMGRGDGVGLGYHRIAGALDQVTRGVHPSTG